jgi:hypothetical protein
MKTFKQFITEYHGEHESPCKESGAPLHNLSGVYPDDIYSADGVRHYGDGTSMDHFSMSIIHSAKNKPRQKISIYRAVPKVLSKDEKISELQSHKAHILKYGKIPRNVDTTLNQNDYYDKISDELNNLQNSPDTPEEKYTINPGDWVTTNRDYAKEHGKDNLNNNYRILRKTVLAKHLYTDGNSIHEYGYHPQ